MHASKGKQMNKWQLPIVLASASPRRAKLLEEAGIETLTILPECDDGVFQCGTMCVERWVQTLAVYKALHALSRCDEQRGTMLGADTVCVVDGNIIGQPQNIEDARNMLHLMMNRSHDVHTGWCLASLRWKHLDCGCEQSEITIGTIDEEEIEKYLCTNRWKGKAGGYNLSERVNAGWPIVCTGDPTTVIGLPMNRLKQELFRSGN